MADAFSNRSDSVYAPARSAFVVTPSNTDLVTIPKALYVGTAGHVSLILIDNDVLVTFKNVAAGQILPVRPKRVLPATTAGDIVALA
jgi:hypothetical protein